jgi:5'-nucleotidase
MRLTAAGLALALAGCATTDVGPQAPVEVKIIAFNDFHGNLEPPRSAIDAPRREEGATRVPAGGAAWFASAVARLRSTNSNNALVSAGDMIGASPLVSSIFLDEPTVHVMNLMRVDFNAVGNHEFDRGRQELLRIQRGGCERYTTRRPCAVDVFRGAKFNFLAANVTTENGSTLFPAYGTRAFGTGRGRVRVGFIGLTLKETPTLVTPAGVAGLTFADEVETINALVPKLRAEGIDAIVVLIHQGLSTKVGYNDKGCDGVDGDLLPILARLDPRVDLVVSGHTHNAYICDYGRIDPSRPFLVTSAGRYGTLITDIELTVDPAAKKVTAKRAENLIVQSQAFGDVELTDRYPSFQPDPYVAAIVARYLDKAGPLANRVVGRMTSGAVRALSPSREMVLGDIIADAHLAATRASGAQIAFTNGYGVRADLQPAADGSVTYGQLFAIQPFGNTLVVKSLTGRQVRALLEQQFDSGSNTASSPNMLLPSSNLRYAYDLSRPAGKRILDLTVDGRPIDDGAVYRVAMNNFLATGGDNFTLFKEGTDPVGGPLDLDALEAWIARSSPLTPPVPDRIRDVTPKR